MLTNYVSSTCTGPEKDFPCVLFPCREKPVLITGFPGDRHRFFPVRKSTQGKPCFHYRDGFALVMQKMMSKQQEPLGTDINNFQVS